MSDKLQKWICRTVCRSLAASFEPLAHCWNVANLSLWYNFGRFSSELTQLVLLLYSWGRSTSYSDILYDFSVSIPRVLRGCLPCTARLQNYLPIEDLPLTCDLNGVKSRINIGVLTIGSFERDCLYALIFLCFLFL